MTFYEEITGLPPFDLGSKDVAGRAQCVLNINAKKNASVTFLEEVIKVITTAGLGTLNVDLFATSNAILPSTGTITTITQSAGAPSLRSHNNISPAWRERPAAKIIVHAVDYVDASAKATLIMNALGAIRNVGITP
jgi:hypothetical protein